MWNVSGINSSRLQAGIIIALLSFCGCDFSPQLLSSGKKSAATAAPTPIPTPFQISWPFTSGTSGSYTSSNAWATVDISAGGVCELTPILHVDQSNAPAGFGSGTEYGVTYGTLSDGTSSGLKLGNTGGCDGSVYNCAGVFDAKWTPKWSNLVAYWKFDNDWNDSIGTNHFTAIAGPSFTASPRVGTKAGQFNNAGSQYLTQADNSNFQFGSGDFAFSYWFYGTQNCAGWGNVWGVGEWNSGGSPGTNSWAINNCSGGGNTNQFGVVMESGATIYSVPALSNWNLSQWYHLVGTRIGDTLYFYINGQLQGTTNVGVASINIAGRNLRVANSDSNSFYTSALFDELAIWKGAGLTAAEAQRIYSQQSAVHSGSFVSRVMDAKSTLPWTTLSWTPTLPFGKPLPDYSGGSVQNESTSDYTFLASSSLMNGIVGLWHLDEAAGTSGSGSVKDSSGKGNHCTPTGPITLGTNAKLNTGVGFGTGYLDCGTSGTLNVGAGSFTVSAWFQAPNTNQMSTLISKRTNGNPYDQWALQIYGTWSGGNPTTGRNIVFILYSSAATSNIVVRSTNPIVDGNWHHVVAVGDSVADTITLYVDGVAIPTTLEVAPTGWPSVSNVAPTQFGSNNTGTGTGNGVVLDEVGIWNRTLSPTEVRQLYARAISRLKFQVRSCSDNLCTAGSPAFIGPDGTSNTYFSELDNISNPSANPTGSYLPGLPLMTFSQFAATPSNNQYFQYRAVFETEDSNTANMPELKSVSVGPAHYDTTVPTIIGKTGNAFSVIYSFIETVGAGGCSSGVRYNLSLDKTIWYYWNGSAWAIANGTVAQANSAAVTQAHLSSIPSQIGTGSIYFKAFLQSSGTSKCELDNLEIDGGL